jgi:hypothetical protein
MQMDLRFAKAEIKVEDLNAYGVSVETQNFASVQMSFRLLAFSPSSLLAF